MADDRNREHTVLTFQRRATAAASLASSAPTELGGRVDHVEVRLRSVGGLMVRDAVLERVILTLCRLRLAHPVLVDEFDAYLSEALARDPELAQ